MDVDRERPRRRRAWRVNTIVFGAASAVGLWLGVAAPSVSPVSPAAPAPPASSSVPNAQTLAAAPTTAGRG